MSHYTIFVKGPLPDFPMTIIHNSANQCIIADGRYSDESAINIAKNVIPHCAEVQVFHGKKLGKLVLQLFNGLHPDNANRQNKGCPEWLSEAFNSGDGSYKP